MRLVFLTIVAIASRQTALRHITTLLRRLGAQEELIRAAGRQDKLVPWPPPGADSVVTQR